MTMTMRTICLEISTKEVKTSTSATVRKASKAHLKRCQASWCLSSITTHRMMTLTIATLTQAIVSMDLMTIYSASVRAVEWASIVVLQGFDISAKASTRFSFMKSLSRSKIGSSRCRIIAEMHNRVLSHRVRARSIKSSMISLSN